MTTSRERLELFGLPERGESWVRQSFFNTTSMAAPELSWATNKACEQNAMVMAVFSSRKCPLSPSQVLSYFPTPQPPLTSIRRAISTLTKAGALVKTETKRKGVYGRSEFVWSLPTGGSENTDSDTCTHPPG